MQPKNILAYNDNLYALDTGQSCSGPSILEIQGVCRMLYTTSIKTRLDHKKYSGVNCKLSIKLWDAFVKEYYKIENPNKIAAITSVLNNVSCFVLFLHTACFEETRAKILMKLISRPNLMNSNIKPNVDEIISVFNNGIEI